MVSPSPPLRCSGLGGVSSESQRLPGAGLAGQRLAGRAEPPGPWETGFGAVRLHLARARPLVVGMKTMFTPRTASAPW